LREVRLKQPGAFCRSVLVFAWCWRIAGRQQENRRGLGVARRDERRAHQSRQPEAPHKKALKLAKVRPFEVYSIRHTFLTRLGESGCDVWTLARVAGHSNISISQRYVHPSEDAVLNALFAFEWAQFWAQCRKRESDGVWRIAAKCN